MKDLTGLIAANTQRSLTVGEVKAAAAEEALKMLSHPHKRSRRAPSYTVIRQYRDVLWLRAADPEASLAELAARLRVSKHTFSSRLRRAFIYAEKVRG